MKKLFILCFVLLSITLVKSQELQWTKGMGGSSSDEGKDIVIDQYGNVYTVGYFWHTVDFDPGPGTFNLSANGIFGIRGVFVSKLDSLGNFIWAKHIRGAKEGISIAVSNNNSIYVLGSFEGSVDLDPESSDYILSASGTTNNFLLKLDNMGHFIWGHQFGGESGEIISRDIDVDNLGNVYMTGNFNDTIDFDPGTGVFNLIENGAGWSEGDVFITKIDSLGNLSWAKQISGSLGSRSYSITTDESNNVYSASHFSGTVDFDPGMGTYNLTTLHGGIGVLKLGTSGNFIWARALTGSSPIFQPIIATGDSGSIYTYGEINGTIDFDPDTGIYNLSGSSDIFISKLDSLGDFLWAKVIINSNFFEHVNMTTDVLGNFYATGLFRGTVDFNPGTGIYNLTTGGITTTKSFLLKLNTSGDFIWAKRFNTSSVRSAAMAAQENGNLFITGRYWSTVDMDPSDYGTYTFDSNGGTDIFISKLGPCIGSIPATLNGILSLGDSICPNEEITLSVNMGNLNNALDWFWYQGSTLLETGPSITVSPNSTTSYEVRGEGPCINPGTFISKSITVNDKPNLHLSGSPKKCFHDTIDLTNINITDLASTNGTFSYWSDINTTVPFPNPTSITNIGTYTVYIKKTTVHGCFDTEIAYPQINPNPSVSYLQSIDTLCETDGQIILSQGIPTGGTYNGPGVTGVTFNPTIAGSGYHEITYTFVDNNTCSDSVTQNIFVDICTGTNHISSCNNCDFKLFPNPSSGSFTIYDEEGIDKIEVRDVCGKLIDQWLITSATSTVKKNIVEPGVYLITIKNRESFKTRRLIIN